MKCSNCGFENQEASKFCEKCGTKLESEILDDEDEVEDIFEEIVEEVEDLVD
jgi:uncharacterized membrane protein YvbJ